MMLGERHLDTVPIDDQFGVGDDLLDLGDDMERIANVNGKNTIEEA